MDLGSLLWVILGISVAWFALSIYMMVWAYRKKGLTGFLLALFLNWVGWIIVASMEADKPERERERTSVY